MTYWPKPRITIGDVPIVLQGFSWSLTAGVLPFMIQIRVDADSSRLLESVRNPTIIRTEAYGGTQGIPVQTVREFQQVYLVEPKPVDNFHYNWTIADVRFSWRGKKMNYSYNKTRQKNERGISVGVPPVDPGSIRRQFDTFSVGRYINLSTSDTRSGRPWTMIEIIQQQFFEQGINFSPSTTDSGDYIVENVEAQGVDIYRGLADLLSRARLQLGIRRTGEVYVYSIDFYNEASIQNLFNQQDTIKTRPGRLYREDKKRIRPKLIQVYFEKKEEIRVVGVRSDGYIREGPLPVPVNDPVWRRREISNWRVIGAENVMPVPYPILSIVSRRLYNIGEYIPIWEYMRSLIPEMPEEWIRSYFFASGLENRYARAIESALGVEIERTNDVFAQRITNVLRQHYRKTYQIDPYYMDRIARWEARRVGVIDNFSRYTPPSPLFSNYAVIPTRRHPALARRQALWDSQVYNYIVDDEDPNRRSATVGSINIVNQALGIFTISYPPLIDFVWQRIIHSALDPLPYPSLSQPTPLLSETNLSENHTLDTVISVVWYTDRFSRFGGRAKYFFVNLNYNEQGGEGPDIEYLSRLEYARYQCRELDENGGEIQNPDIPVNQGILQNLAQAEGAKLINQYRDRYSGHLTIAGWPEIELHANMKSVTYSFSPRSGAETSIDMREIPPSPSLEQVLDQNTINYLFRQVSRADEVSEVPS